MPLVVAPLIPSGQGPQVGVRTPSATVNLSAGGLLVEGEVALPLQSMVRLELDLGDGHRPLLAHGQVIRLDLVGQRPVFGVSFVAIGKQDLSRLHRLLYRVGLAAKPAS